MGSFLRLESPPVPTLVRSSTWGLGKAREEGSSGYFSCWVLGMLRLSSRVEGKEKLGVLARKLLGFSVTRMATLLGAFNCPKIAFVTHWEAPEGGQSSAKSPDTCFVYLSPRAKSLAPLLCGLGAQGLPVKTHRGRK